MKSIPYSAMDSSLILLVAVFAMFFVTCNGQVSVSSSAAASVKYNKGAPQAYISSLSSAKADPKIPVNIIGGGSSSGNIVVPTGAPSSAAPSSPGPTTKPAGHASTKSPTESSSEVKTTWAYKASSTAYGPENWGMLSPKCNGKHQSPIDISTATMKKMPLSSKLTLASANTDPTVAANLIASGKLINNGKALGFNVDHTKTPIKLTGVIFRTDTYTLRQFHFHIGCEGQLGSEHSLNGEKFPGEIHMVFTNDKYPDAKAAMQQSDGLASLAFFIKYDPTAANPALERISKNLQNLRNPHGTVPIPDGISLTNMIPALKEGITSLRRFAYKGSLPTPPCFESVTWVVFNRPVSMHPDAMEKWRNLLQSETDRICGNFRPIQPLNDRRVYGFVPLPETKPAPTTTAAAHPSEEALETAGVVPAVQQLPLSKLVGGPVKALEDQPSFADARHELNAGPSKDDNKSPQSGTPAAEAKGKSAEHGPVDAPQVSTFSKTPADKEGTLNPENNSKQEANKDTGKINNFAAKPVSSELVKDVKALKNKPTVAPGMRRQY